MQRRPLVLFLLLVAFPGIIRAAEPAVATAPPERDPQSWCISVTRAIPQIKPKTCVAAELRPVPVKSVMGRQIMLREFKPAQKKAARVLVVGGIHGDELTAVSVVFRWLE
jgi:protein MpaA